MIKKFLFITLLIGIAPSFADKRTDATQTIVVHELIKKTLKKHTHKKGESCKKCPECVTVDKKNYYPTMKMAVRNTNKKIVQFCKKRAPVNKRIKVDYTAKHICKKKTLWPDEYRKSKVRYDTFWKVDGPHIELNLRFKFKKKMPLSAIEVYLDTAKWCTKNIKDVWARYGIHFDLKVDAKIKPKFNKPHHIVQIKAEECESDVETFCVKPAKGKLCNLLLHETGHMLGFPDENFDRSCKDRVVANEKDPYSIMEKPHYAWDNIDFFPRHIRKLLAPTCKP